MNNNNTELNETESSLSALNRQLPTESESKVAGETAQGTSVSEKESLTQPVEPKEFPDLSAFSFELPPLDAIDLPSTRTESLLPVELPDTELRFTEEEMPDLSLFDRFLNSYESASDKALLNELFNLNEQTYSEQKPDELPAEFSYDLPEAQLDLNMSLSSELADKAAATDAEPRFVENEAESLPREFSSVGSDTVREEPQEYAFEETPLAIAASSPYIAGTKHEEIEALPESSHTFRNTSETHFHASEAAFSLHDYPEIKHEPPAEDLNGDILNALIADIDSRAGDYFKFEEEFTVLTPTPDVSVKEEQHVIFVLDDTSYSMPINNVAEIGRPLNVTSLPNVPSWVLGVANLRGDIISVVDFRAFLGKGRRDSLSDSRMMVVRSEKENITTALVVDKVREIRHIAVNKISTPTAPVEDRIVPFMRGVYEHNGRLLVLLDAERLMLSPEMQQFELSGN